MNSKTSIIIPAHNEETQIEGLIESLKKQTHMPLEVILVDDCSTDATAKIASTYFKVITTPKSLGPAAARNLGMKAAQGEYFAFLDADCRPGPNWVEQVERQFAQNGVDVIMGEVNIPPSSVLGDAIAALGFPGGGALGFEKMWRVGPDGTTDHISSLNFALRKCVYEKYGGFDESFPFNCEDAEFSHRLTKNKVKIKFVPELRIEHESMESLKTFIRWHYKRGVGNYHFKKKIGKVGNFVKLRIWSSMNILRTYSKDLKLPLIFSLLFLSFILQQWGYFVEARRNNQN